MTSHKQKIEKQLYEKVDVLMLQKLISATRTPEDIRNQLKRYYGRLNNGTILVNYSYTKDIDEQGRLYAQGALSLQSFKKEIRHALAKDIYWDVDMINGGPNILFQYCLKHAIPCSKLEDYVINRDEILQSIQKLHEITREQAKQLILRIIYNGSYKIKNDDESEYEPVDKHYKVLKFKKEMQEIARAVTNIEKGTYELVMKGNKENKEASCLSITIYTIENKCLMAMYNYFKSTFCTVGVFCFDGLMIEKNDEYEDNLDLLLEKCEQAVLENTEYEIKL